MFETLPIVYLGFLHWRFSHQCFLLTFKDFFFYQRYTSHILDLRKDHLYCKLAIQRSLHLKCQPNSQKFSMHQETGPWLFSEWMNEVHFLFSIIYSHCTKTINYIFKQNGVSADKNNTAKVIAAYQLFSVPAYFI